MNTAELTALHAETIQAAVTARTRANITRRASTLWEDGYTAQETMHGLYVRCFLICSPKNDTYRVKVSKTFAEPGTPFGSSCSCPCFETFRTCKHLEALSLWVDVDDAAEAQADRYDADCADADTDPYAEF